MATRLYAGEADLQAMIDLLKARPAERIADFPSIVDLREMLGTSHIQANTRLWENPVGQLMGFAIMDMGAGHLMFEATPQATGDDVEAQIIAWGEARVKRASRERGKPITLQSGCSEDNTERIALLEGHGFVVQEDRTLSLIRPLNEPIPAPQLPAGFVIRHLEGEHEVEALVALHRAAFGTENMTVEHRIAMMRVPEYEPALDLIAVAPDGTFAAYCMCHISREENALTGRADGYTDPVATHPAFQRRGMAKALLLTGLDLLRQRSMETARLGTSSENIAMQRTAALVGFRVESEKIWFAKQVPAI
ncbi:GNAT family N-acetyltransferase [Candidatus Poribacteria bacterium]|nr:GNAT family N-acetyltransferase [Candidatus Poribacteria bacterium]